MSFFTELDKNMPRFIWKHKLSLSVKVTLSGENTVRVIIRYSLKVYYPSIVTKTSRSMEDDRRSRGKLTQLWKAKFWQDCKKNTQKISVCWINGASKIQCKRVKLDSSLSFYTSNSNWTNDLNLEQEMLILAKETWRIYFKYRFM